MPESDLALLLRATEEAGQRAFAHWRREPEIWTKDDASPVSQADLDTNDALHAMLTGARPAYGWLSEESDDSAARRASEHCFIVDPIDGTRAFLAGERNWALSVAIATAGQVSAAVIHMPARGLTFAAERGGGATLNGSQIIASRQVTGMEGASLLAAKPTYAPQHWRGAVPGFDRHFRSSLAYRVALVAQGRFDAMMTLRAVWEWDIAAGVLIASEAGAEVSDRRGAPLVFNTANRQTDGAVVATNPLHGAILAALA